MFFEEQIKDLVNEIKNTSEFKEFKKAKTNIDKYRNLKEELEYLQENQMQLYSMNMEGKDVKPITTELNTKFQKLSQTPEVCELLNSGKAFNDMMYRVYNAIQNSLDSEFHK